MAHWQDRFLGIGELPPEQSVFEIEFFQFSPHDIAAIRKEFRPKYRIAVALQLGFMRLTVAKLNAFNAPIKIRWSMSCAARGFPYRKPMVHKASFDTWRSMISKALAEKPGASSGLTIKLT